MLPATLCRLTVAAGVAKPAAMTLAAAAGRTPIVIVVRAAAHGAVRGTAIVAIVVLAADGTRRAAVLPTPLRSLRMTVGVAEPAAVTLAAPAATS